MNGVDALMAALAQRQYGLLSRSQGRVIGLTDNRVRRRLESGRLLLVERNVLAVAGVPPSWEQAVMRAILSTEQLAVASHSTAAYLWGMIETRPERIEIAMYRWQRADRDFVVHESTDLVDADRTELRGIPITTPPRTAVDMGASAPWLVERALDAGIRRRLFTLEEVARTRARVGRRGRRGAGVIRPAIEARLRWDGLTESELEDLFRRVWTQSGRPMPVPQHVIVDAQGVFVCRSDFAFTQHKVRIELDSEAHHMDRQQFRRDRSVQNRTEVLGWVTLRYTWWDLVTRPGQVIAEISAVLDRLSPGLSPGIPA